MPRCGGAGAGESVRLVSRTCRSGRTTPMSSSTAARRSSSPASRSRRSNVPGHSPGHVAYYAEGALFSGDVLFAGSVGRTDLPFSDWDTLVESIRTLMDALPAGDRRLLRPRPGDDARRRARPQSVPRRAARLVKFEAPRGTHDVLPVRAAALARRSSARPKRSARSTATGGSRRRASRTRSSSTRTSGAGSDIVQKEMYTFADRGGRSLTLRPEGTAPIARAYVEHGLHREPQPVKTFFIGPMYRYAAPQRGKFREFWQFDVEAIGSDDPAVDAEVIQLFVELLRRLEIGGWWLELNSIGDRNCRPAYLEQLDAWLDEHADELDEETRAKRETSPLRVFDTLPEAGERAAGPGAGADDRRVAVRGVRGALRAASAATSTRTGSSTGWCRPSSAGSTTTRARPSSSWARRSARSPRSAAAAATTT